MENIDKQQQLRDYVRKRWEEIGITKETQDRISEYAKQINSHSSSEIEWPIIKKFVQDFNKEYEIPENSIEEKIDELWHEYHKLCEGCVGNGCDDCRDCDKMPKKDAIYKEIQKLKNEKES